MIPPAKTSKVGRWGSLSKFACRPCSLCGLAAAQTPNYPYLLRLEHSSFDAHSCALLQTTGAFHLEIYDGDNVKVHEGTIPPNDLLEIEADLNTPALVDLSQQQIEEPLIRTRHDELQVTVLRGDGWQDLFFRSSDSQRPFEGWLGPLVRWLDNLHKLPHRDLSEDEGRNNCLPPKPITLKRRDVNTAPAAVTSKTNAHILSTEPALQPQLQPSQTAKPKSVPALLHMYLIRDAIRERPRDLRSARREWNVPFRGPHPENRKASEHKNHSRTDQTRRTPAATSTARRPGPRENSTSRASRPRRCVPVMGGHDGDCHLPPGRSSAFHSFVVLQPRRIFPVYNGDADVECSPSFAELSE